MGTCAEAPGHEVQPAALDEQLAGDQDAGGRRPRGVIVFIVTREVKEELERLAAARIAFLQAA